MMCINYIRLIRTLSFVLCVGWWLSVTNIAVSQSGSLPDDYWALVDYSIRELEESADIDGLIAEWLAFTDPEDLFQPTLIVEQLKRGDSDADIEAHLAMFYALQETRQTWPEVNMAEGEGDGRDLESFLAQEKYQYDSDARADNFAARFLRNMWDWLFGRLDNFNDASARDAGDSRSGGGLTFQETDSAINMTGVIAALLLGFILFMLFQRVRLGLSQDAVVVSEEAELLETLTVAEAMEKAEETAERGHYRHSVRYLYLSTLLILEENGYLKTDRSLTNQEYIQAMQHHPNKARTLRDVVTVFDRVWYGKAEIDQETLESYQARIRELQDEEPSV